MSWDDLIIGARWPKCGHPRTPENTQGGHRQSDRCKVCHREAARDYYLRCCEGVSRGAEDFATLDQTALKSDRARAAELGGEFLKAINRWATLNHWRGA